MSLRNRTNNRSPLGQAWHVGTYPFRMFGKLGLPLFAAASKVKGVGGADSRSYRTGNTLYSYDNEVIRKGDFFGNTRNYKNNEIIPHSDVIKTQFTTNMIIDQNKKNWCDDKIYKDDVRKSICSAENDRYHPCSAGLYCLCQEDRRPREIIYLDEDTIRKKWNDQDKNNILAKVKKNFSNLLKCAENSNQKTDTFAFDFVVHSVPGGKYDITNLRPQDFSDIFEKAMQSGYKKLYITEGSCFNSGDMIDTLTNVAKNNNYCGDIIIKRNSKYNKEFDYSTESSQDRKLENTIWHMPEFVHIKDGKISCISENDARKILGGSYLDNIKYNEAHNLGDEVRNKKECSKFTKQFQYEGQCEEPKNTCNIDKDTCNARNSFLYDIE